ncbi:MAG: Trk system potassium transporter TrkA [Arenicellales bacterium]|jgi:trk system potassium uptake protein TrkA
MKIIILGAGQVGTSVTEILSREAGGDITLVDIDEERLSLLQNRFDIRTVHGHASYPDVLREAGCDDAELILAVTNSDETNITACQIASILFNTPRKIARIRATEYVSEDKLFAEGGLGVDHIISPEQIVTTELQRLIERPGALQVLDFANGRIQLVAIKAYHDGPLVGHQLRALKDHLSNIETRVVAIYREGEAIMPDGDTVIEDNDEVFFIAATEHIRDVMSEMRKLDKPVRTIMLAGAGNIGFRLAEALEQKNYQVKLIEQSPERATEVSKHLKRTIVLVGDSADEELLRMENIDKMDVFCAITNDDEANILSAMLAKQLGARRVMSIVNRTAYADLIERTMIDIAYSPKQATIGSVLPKFRTGALEAVHSLRLGTAEAIEAIALDDQSSKVVGRRIDEIPLPKGTIIGAILRDEEVIIPHHDTVINNLDHIILFVQEKKHIDDVVALFQVSAFFI